MRALSGNALVAVAALLVATPSQAAEATVVCKDGTTAQAGRGACRGHRGIDKDATAKAAGGAGQAAVDAKGKEAKESLEKGEGRATGKAAAQAAGEMVLCKDGTTAKAGRGACRGHHGVDKAATAKGAGAAPAPPAAASIPAPPPPPQAAAAPPLPAQAAPSASAARRAEKAASEDEVSATARCKDGTFSHAKHHTGACSNHGGVAEWLDKK